MPHCPFQSSSGACAKSFAPTCRARAINTRPRSGQHGLGWHGRCGQPKQRIRSSCVDRDTGNGLESTGYAVVDTEMTRSVLAGPGLKRAKQGHTLGSITLNLFYATDFVDRFESQILPALRAGFIVLTDRYIYSLMARALVRGADPTWIRSIYGLALKPDAIFYLKIGIGELIPRVLQRGGFDFWESGMDMRLGEDLFESFVNYQTIMLEQFALMTDEYGFQVLDASLPVEQLNEELKHKILPLLPHG